MECGRIKGTGKGAESEVEERGRGRTRSDMTAEKREHAKG